MNWYREHKYFAWLSIVILIAILLRVWLFTSYQPITFSDTNSYRRSANAVLAGFDGYDGTRTPGYPVFMALIGPDQAIFVSQLILGFVITMIWFFIGYKSTGQPYFGGLMALAHTLNPGQLFFEANLLTETLTTFLLTLALLGGLLWLYEPRVRKIWLAIVIGLLSGLSTLTRPLFIFMPFLLAAFLAIEIKNKKIKIEWKPIISVLFPAMTIIVGWMMWINSNFNTFSLTTMTGYHLVQHTGYYFESVPDEYADLRDIYLEYRDERIRERGSQGNAIWDAIPAMQAATGMSFYHLSRTLQRISIDLILRNPFAYLGRVIRGWWFFWRAPVYWNQTVFSSLAFSSFLGRVILVVRGMLFLINLGFIISSSLFLIFSRFRKIFNLTTYHWLLAASIWAASILSSLLDHGDNPRFLIPLQTAVVFWTLWIGQKIYSIIREKMSTGVIARHE